MTKKSFLDSTEDELLSIANGCLNRAGSAAEVPQENLDDLSRLRLFLEAQLCLTEVVRKRADQAAERDRRRNEEIAERDFRLERRVVWLIGVEIVLSIVFGGIGLYEGWKQGKALDHTDSSTAATATAMSAVSKSLQSLTDAQAKSLDRLNQMSETLRDSLKTNSTMAGATRKQLDILQHDQAERATQLAKKPKLRLFIGSVSVVTGSFNALHPPTYPIRDQTDTSVTFDSSILNEGTASATKLQVRVVVLATDVSFSATAYATPASEPPDNPFKTWLINFPFIRPNVNMPMTLTFSFPKGRTPFDVAINVDADEIETATPLGNFTITPRAPAKEK